MELVIGGGARIATLEAVGADRAPVAEEREVALALVELQGRFDAEPAAKLAVSGRALAQSVLRVEEGD